MPRRHYASLEVVINRCYGGFGLSRAAIKRLVELGFELLPAEAAYITEWPAGYFCFEPVNLLRHDPRLIQVVKELGKAANGDSADLRIVNVDCGYEIVSHDGVERVDQ